MLAGVWSFSLEYGMGCGQHFGGGRENVSPKIHENHDVRVQQVTSPLFVQFHSIQFVAIGPKLSLKMSAFSIRSFIPPLSRRLIPLRATRRYAVQAPGAPTMEIFSHQQKWLQKERAAQNTESSRNVDYLRDEVASRLCERVLVCGCERREVNCAEFNAGYKPPIRSRTRPGSKCV